MAKPDISIVVGLYKRPQYIAPLMESIFAQTLSNWELIFVDDGSEMPELTEVCRRYEREDKRIRYVYQEHKCFAAAIKRGAAEATADYVTIIGDDDFIAPTRLQNQVAFLRENPQVMMVKTYLVFVDKEGKRLPRQPSSPENSDVPIIYPPQDALAPIQMGAGPGMCFCRQRLLEAGGFDADFLNAEDDEMVLRVLDRHSIAVLRERSYFWRRHGAAQMGGLPEQWKYVAAAYGAAYHRRNNIPEPEGARPFNLLSSMGHLPADVASMISSKARGNAKRFLRQKQYEGLAKLLDDFHAAFSFDRKHHRKMYLNLLAWVFIYGKFPALPVILRGIAR